MLGVLDQLIKKFDNGLMSEVRNRPVRETRIQAANREIILAAALEIFSAFGFRGSTVDQIAARANMSKPNLLYYFRRKEDIYVALLEHTLADWLKPLEALDPRGDPIEELSKYISAKIAMSRDNPKASRLFANEILHGAPMIGRFLGGPLRELVDRKAMILRDWSAAGRIAPVDPYHLIFAIWAVTQHYADFDVQVEAVSAGRAGDPREAVLQLFLDGLRPRQPSAAAGA
jgi:TetR/AcrR family transcriptional regulator